MRLPSSAGSSVARVILFLVCCFAFSVAYGQVDQGSVTGTIHDSQKNVISGATVTIVNDDTNLTLTRQTGDTGAYNFTPLKIGTYTLTISAPGFTTIVQQNVHVDVSQTVGLSFSLKPGAVNETVTVSSEPDIQNQDASTGQVFSAQVLNDIPLDGRNYVFAAQLTTGVAAPNQGFSQVAGSGDFTSNGNRVSENNFVLDGVDNNSNMQDFLNGATYAVRPPPDALGEFKVESSDYSAELGHSTGAAINASIKSGTNKIHGSVWEYLENDRMNALDYFSTTHTSDHHNVFGATLGGPIWKDKIFIFADAQGDRISTFRPAQADYTVPTALMRTGDFSELLNSSLTNGYGAINLYQAGGNVTYTAAQAAADTTGKTIEGTDNPAYAPRYLNCNGVQNVICSSQINAVAQKVLNLYPLPNEGVSGQTFKNYTAPASAITNDTTQFDVRLDYNFSSKDQMFGRYSYSNNPESFVPPLGVLDGGSFGSDGQNSNYGKSGVFSETHFFSPTLSNEFRLGFNYLHASYLQQNATTNIAQELGYGGIPTGPTLGGLPATNFGDSNSGNRDATQIGVTGYLPSDEKQDVFQIIDNVNKQLGVHTLKAGINFQHVRFYGLQPPNGIGYQNFNGTYTSDPGQPNAETGDGLADFLMDEMNNSGLSSTTPFTDLRWYFSSFVQDDWKVNSRLTLNLGLRWEYTQPIHELNNLQSNFYGTFGNNNTGTGTLLIPQSQSAYPISTNLATTLAADNITVKYTNNNYLVNPRKLNFAPRIGISYMVDPKTVLRAGGGFFYGGLENIGLGLNLANNAPFFVNANFVPTPDSCTNEGGNTVCPTNGQTLETGFGDAATSASALAAASGENGSVGSIYAQDQNAKSAYTVAYNLSLQHSISDSLSFTIGYQGNESRHLRSSYNANDYAGYIPSNTTISSQDYQPFHDFSIVNITSGGIGRYDSLQAKMEKRYSNGLYFLAGYTWAHCLDDAFGPIGQSEAGGYRNPNLLGIRYDYGNCTQDVRNRFSATAQYELPFGHNKAFLNKSKIADATIGGWKTSFIFQAQTGDPIFITSSNQGSSYPYKVGDPFAAGGTADSATQPGFVCATKTRTRESWFNPCAFANPPQAVLGASDATQNLINVANAGLIPSGPKGRVGVTGPGFQKVDFSLFKTFPLHFRESNVQLRADAFNLFNHPSFGNPGSGLQGSGSQEITNTRFSTLIPDARVIQVSGKLTF